MKQNKIWDYFQCESPNSFSGSEKRINHIFNYILKNTSNQHAKILNIGIGNGSLEILCKKQGWIVYSLDPSEEPINEITKKGIFGKVGYIQEIPLEDGYFDFVIISEVLEHLTDDDLLKGVAEAVRVLKINGVLVGTVPYREVLASGVTICPDCGKKFHRWGHMQSFDKQQMKKLLSRQKLDILRLSVKSFVDFSRLNLFGKFKLLPHWSLGKMGVQMASPTLFFSCRKVG